MAARQSEGPLAPNQLFDVATIVLRVKGSDLVDVHGRSDQARRGSAEGRGQGLLIYNPSDEGARRRRLSLHWWWRCRRWRRGCGTPIDIKQAVQIAELDRRLVRRRDQGRQEQAHAERYVPGEEADRRSDPSTLAESRLQEDHTERRGRLRRLLRSERHVRRRQRERAADGSHRDGLHRATRRRRARRCSSTRSSRISASSSSRSTARPTGSSWRRFDIPRKLLATIGCPLPVAQPPPVAEPPPPASQPALERRLGPLDAAAIIVSNVIGGGILFTPPQVAASVPESLVVPVDVGRRRRAGVRRRDGLRGTGGAAAPRRRRVRLPASGVRTAGGVSDRLDVVHRRLLGRDRGERGRPRGVRRTVHPCGQRRDTALRRPAAVRAADVLASRRRWRSARSR